MSNRYQLLPTARHIQFDIEGSIGSIEDLKRKKNELTYEVAGAA